VSSILFLVGRFCNVNREAYKAAHGLAKLANLLSHRYNFVGKNSFI
jgi:hypothetical protein